MKVGAVYPNLRENLADLPRYQCLMFGGLNVVILHGDAESLAGRGLSHEVLNRQGTGQLTGWFRRTGADVIICTHTCLPVMGHLEVDGRPRLFLNNGFVGMGNLAGDAAGLGARIALSPPPEGAYTLSLAPPLSAALVPVHFPLAP